jgi:hypothetical protein
MDADQTKYLVNIYSPIKNGQEFSIETLKD